jgi:hypothetical protein
MFDFGVLRVKLSSTFPRVRRELKVCMRENEETFAGTERKRECAKSVQQEAAAKNPFLAYRFVHS